MEEVVEADTHVLTIRLAGRFRPTEDEQRNAVEAAVLNDRLVGRAQAAGVLRPDIDPHDLSVVFEQVSHVTAATPPRNSPSCGPATSPCISTPSGPAAAPPCPAAHPARASSAPAGTPGPAGASRHGAGRAASGACWADALLRVAVGQPALGRAPRHRPPRCGHRLGRRVGSPTTSWPTSPALYPPDAPTLEAGSLVGGPGGRRRQGADRHAGSTGTRTGTRRSWPTWRPPSTTSAGVGSPSGSVPAGRSTSTSSTASSCRRSASGSTGSPRPCR